MNQNLAETLDIQDVSKKMLLTDELILHSLFYHLIEFPSIRLDWLFLPYE